MDENPFTKLMLLPANPKKHMILVQVVGLGHCFTTSIYIESNKIPSIDNICITKEIDYNKN